MKYLVAACLLTLCAVAVAQTVTQPAQPGAVDSERQRISAERGKLEAEFSAEHATCYKKFAVNNCLGDVNEKRREAMAHLRRKEILLNDQERKQKAAEQLRKIEEKSSVQKQQEDADHRAEALSRYQSRLAKEKQKEAARVSLQSREQANTEARTSRLLGNQQKPRHGRRGQRPRRKKRASSMNVKKTHKIGGLSMRAKSSSESTRLPDPSRYQSKHCSD